MNFLSKLVIVLLDPLLWVLILAICAGLAAFLGRRKWARRFGLGSTALLLFLAVVPAGDWMLRPLENRFPPLTMLPDSVDGIVVLGGAIEPEASAERGQVAVNANAERLIALLSLARRYPEARILYTGGTGDPFDQRYRESDSARRLLGDIGFDLGRVRFERESRNTHENARTAFHLVGPAAGERWLLVTSARHMPRAIGAFRAAGWTDLVAYPVDYRTGRSTAVWAGLDLSRNSGELASALREWIGMIGYRLLGRIDSWFPAPETGASRTMNRHGKRTRTVDRMMARRLSQLIAPDIDEFADFRLYMREHLAATIVRRGTG